MQGGKAPANKRSSHQASDEVRSHKHARARDLSRSPLWLVGTGLSSIDVHSCLELCPCLAACTQIGAEGGPPPVFPPDINEAWNDLLWRFDLWLTPFKHVLQVRLGTCKMRVGVSLARGHGGRLRTEGPGAGVQHTLRQR